MKYFEMNAFFLKFLNANNALENGKANSKLPVGF